MGFDPEQERMPTVYVSIFDGNLITRAKETDQGAVSRVNKESKTVWEHHHKNGLSGTLMNITAAQNQRIAKNPWEFIIEMRDAAKRYIISVAADSRYGEDLACKIPSLEYGKETKVKPFDFENPDDKEKKIIGITFIQEGAKVPRFITKDNPMGRPQTEGRLDDDDYKIHMVKVKKFYREIVMAHGNPDKGKPEAVSSEASQPATTSAVKPNGDFDRGAPPPTEEDDLPF